MTFAAFYVIITKKNKIRILEDDEYLLHEYAGEQADQSTPAEK